MLACSYGLAATSQAAKPKRNTSRIRLFGAF